MAIAFPNFLQAPIQQTDYSGLGDVVGNFYAGYNAPKDALIKAVQAQFARPEAEQTLLSSKLSNRKSDLDIQKSQIDIQKTLRDMAQEKALNDMFSKALGGGSNAAMVPNPSAGMGSQPTPIAPPQNMPSTTMSPSPTNMTMMNSPAALKINPAMTQALGNALGQSPNQNISQVPVNPLSNVQPVVSQPPVTQNMSSQPAAMAGTPSLTSPQPVPAEQAAPMNEIVISKGSPQLAGIDAMYENNPVSRAFLEKKGYKKKQEIKFDNKTGRTSIITTYPSGKVTMQTAGEGTSGEGIPLTSKMISKHQNIISSVDNALPIIQEIQALNEQVPDKNGTIKDKYYEPYPRSSGIIPGLGYIPGFQSQSTKYEALVKSALDSLIGAYGLPLSNEGLETVRGQLLIGHGETDSAYKKRLANLVKDLERRKSYSEAQVKQSNKAQPIGRMGGGDETYSSDDWEPAQ